MADKLIINSHKISSDVYPNLKPIKPKTGTFLANKKYENNILQSFVNDYGFGFDFYLNKEKVKADKNEVEKN